jgi:hypothetical protein
MEAPRGAYLPEVVRRVGGYVSVLVGDRPDLARPVVASSDRAVVSAVLRAIMGRVGGPALLEAVEAERDEGEREAADG